jgi:hypothetical protein
MAVTPPPVRPRLAVRPAVIRPAKPSPARYWVAGLIAVVGLVAGIAWAVFAVIGYQDHIDGFARTAVPGQVSVSVSDPGGKTVYYEGTGEPTLADLRITVTGPRGNRVPVHRYSGTLRYDSPEGTRARAVGTFHAAASGVYVVTSASSRDLPGELAVGDSFVLRTVVQAVLIVGLVLISFGTALALALVTFLQRRRI